MIPLFKVFMAEEATKRTAETLMSGYIGEGPRVQEFEQAFGQLVGATDHPPLALNSCTSALDLALHLVGVHEGELVISTPMTCTATNGVIVNRGAQIAWADVDPVTGLIDPASVARIVREARVTAIMAVDWAGRSCDYTALRRAAVTTFRSRTYSIPIIQDAAHNLMVDMANHGDYVCWSFQAIKHLTTGDGGAILVPPEQRKRARLLRWYGLDRESSADYRCDQDITEAGFKYHMNDIAASIGLANLPHMPQVVRRYQSNAIRYGRLLADAPGVMVPPAPASFFPWLYCLLVDDVDGFRAHMAARGVATSPVHKRNDVHPAFNFPSGPLPGVERFSAHQVSIPVGWWLTDSDIEHIAGAVLEWAHQHTKELTHAA